MLLVLLLDIFIVLCFLVTGFVVLNRESKAALNRLFFAFLSTISLWVISNYFSNNFDIGYKAALVANHLTLFAPGIVLILLLSFSLTLSKRKLTNNWWMFITAGVVLYTTSLTPLMFDSIERQGDVYAINFTSLGNAYFLFMLINMVAVVTILLKGRARATGQEKARLNAIFWGVTILLMVNVATNLLLPVVGNLYALTNIGPLSGIFVVYALWLSIVKHRLFDIRLLIARSIAYALSLGAIAAIYALFSYGVTTSFHQIQNSKFEAAINVLLLVIVAITFAPIKRRFDRVTNKFFYRDAYDPQQFIDQLNRVAITNVDIESLLNRSSEIVNKHLKTSFCTIELRPTAYKVQRILGDVQEFSAQDILQLRDLTAPIKTRVVVTEELQESDPKLYKLLDKYDIGAVSKMSYSVSSGVEGIGLMLFGIKKSGNSFSREDKRVISIISSELTVATQNALRFEEIESFSATLQEKVDDATKRLQRANEKLKTMDETKDEFISMASHQLRTPLTSVKGYVSMVLEGDAGPLNDMQKKLLEQSFISSQRMVYLIADLLNLSRLKTGRFVIENVPCNLAQVIEGEVEQLKETAAGKKMSLAYRAPKKFPTYMLDETKIRQVIMNFVDNAIYYTPAGGKIEISLVEKANSVEFTVKDNGIGVPAAEQHYLFNKFYRAKNAQKARPDGTGLGLFMAKKVVIAQGGALIFDSQVGKGSTFGFSFAKAKLQIAETTQN
jgi:signal transduction histidine kinase